MGYYNLKYTFKSTHGEEASVIIIKRIFDSLDQNTQLFKENTDINWLRYGDGYVFYSPNNDVEYLNIMIFQYSQLIAHSLNISIPLRIAIAQNTLKAHSILK